MKLCGRRTRSLFDRYNIIDEQDLARAVAKRSGSSWQAANAPCAEAGSETVSSSSERPTG